MSHMPHCFHSEARCCPDLIFKSVWRRKAAMQDWRREAASVRVPLAPRGSQESRRRKAAAEDNGGAASQPEKV